MHILLITLAVIAGLFIFVCILAALGGLYESIFYPHGHDVSPEQVRKELELILDDKHPYALDDFTSGRFKDPRLEAIRLRIEQLPAEFPPESQRQYCNPKGWEVIRGYVRELEHETAA
jgi:hypothetical protein